MQNTHDAYNKNMLNVLEKISSTHMGQIVSVSLVVATHNVQSVELCKESLKELKNPHSRVDLVVFGQLLGMSDFIMIEVDCNDLYHKRLLKSAQSSRGDRTQKV